MTAEQNVKAFLKMLRVCEGTDGPDGYRRMNGYERFKDFSRHPNRVGKGGSSTAAGAYQFTIGTWNELRLKLNLPDFTPPNQDKGAVELIRQAGALELIQQGRFNQAMSIVKLRKRWASLPGGSQQQKNLAQVRAIYQSNGGAIAA